MAGLAAVACAGLGARAAAQEAAGGAPAAVAGGVSEDTRRDVEVMRRVLVKEALGSPGVAVVPRVNDKKGALLLALDYAYRPLAGAGASEAFVVPGDGATFLLRTSDPVAPAGAAPVVGAEAAEPSAWDEAANEVDGKPRTKKPVFRFATAYDSAKVDALRARILDQLARYGRNIRGLAASDHLTVIVVGSGQNTPTAQLYYDALSGAQSADPPFEVGIDYGPSRATVLTVRVAVSDCQAFGRNEIDLDGFRRRAVVSQY